MVIKMKNSVKYQCPYIKGHMHRFGYIKGHKHRLVGSNIEVQTLALMLNVTLSFIFRTLNSILSSKFEC